jgi:hypothetical protein
MIENVASGVLCWGVPICWFHNIAKFNSPEGLCFTIGQRNETIYTSSLDYLAILFSHIVSELTFGEIGVQVFHEVEDGDMNV